MARRAGGGKYCVEGCRFVDALDLRRKGYLQPPAAGKPPYAITANCGGREQHIATAWTPCRFGGKRPWFQCSYCARRGRPAVSSGACSPVVTATGWAMRASWRRLISGGLDGRRKSAGGWLVARTTRSWRFPPGHGACTRKPTSVGVEPMTTPKNGRPWA